MEARHKIVQRVCFQLCKVQKQDKSMGWDSSLEVRVVTERSIETSGVLGRFHFLIYIMVTQVCSFCET